MFEHNSRIPITTSRVGLPLSAGDNDSRCPRVCRYVSDILIEDERRWTRIETDPWRAGLAGSSARQSRESLGVGVGWSGENGAREIPWTDVANASCMPEYSNQLVL
jgi:hypothetical protein